MALAPGVAGPPAPSSAPAAPAKTRLLLGDFEFKDFEVPEQIAIGGAQRLGVHKLIGGKRVIDALGRDDAPVCWSGIFLSENAQIRARRLDYMRAQGDVLTLTWDEMSYQVVICDLTIDYKRRYHLPYRISLVVLQDNTKPVPELPAPKAQAQSLIDTSVMKGITDDLGLPDVAEAVTTMRGALDTVAPIIGGTKLYQTAVKALSGVDLATKGAISIAEGDLGAAIGSTVQLGGLFGGASARGLAGQVLSGVSAAKQMAGLQQVQDIGNRIGVNLATLLP